ncbi:MAG: diacylglycerol kinase [Candidatus Aminicenantes bacterium]|nr:diacylglycerol kinase [Candidatus Aminicenantes bacterium]
MSSPSQWPVMRIFTRWFGAANNAAEGILQAAKTQRHLQFHLLTACAVLLGCFVIGLDKLEFAAIALITIVVIVAELFNSALEAAVDLASPDFKPLARIAKDIAAGAVLISAVGALVIGTMIIGPHLVKIWRGFYRIPRHTAGNIAVLALILIMEIVIFIKAYGGVGHPLRGGFPSGHTASAFSLWISLIHMTANPWLIGLGLLAAVLVAASRLRMQVHTFRDVFFGALLGSSITLVLFRVFWH